MPNRRCSKKIYRTYNELKLKEEGFNAIGHFCSGFPPQINDIVCNCIRNYNQNSKVRRYGNNFKRLPLGAYLFSALAYGHLKPILRFPEEGTLDELVSECSRDPGCTNSRIWYLELGVGWESREGL